MEIRALLPSETAFVDERLPLSRLDNAQTYLIAWDGEDPVGHAHLAWEKTYVGVPEIQDVYVLPERRRSGVATALTGAAEAEARARGFDRISLSVSADKNDAARRLYESLGYEDAGLELVRALGTIMLRGEPFDVDDWLFYMSKNL